jgi:molybdopterin-guanine dinucleotide biosynthesis protein A
MQNKHQKHAHLQRPACGYYSKNEWAILGTTCSDVKDLYVEIQAQLSGRLSSAYIDADHHHDQGKELDIKSGKLQLRLSPTAPLNEYDIKNQLRSADFTLVNGNHYPAQKQILVINQEKKESLRKRLDQIHQIDLIIRRTEDERVFSFIREKLKTHKEKVPVFQWHEKEKIADYIFQLVLANRAGMKALILGGGRSKRMGTDKSQIDYHGKPQEIHMADLCAGLGLDVYLSKRDSSQVTTDKYPVIYDKLPGLGPFGAISSAFMTDPDAAWLVLACDLPYIDTKEITQLIENRNPFKAATCFKGASKSFPEPLITIWEPKAYPRLLAFLAEGYSCPRKVLINSDCEIIEIEDERIITNINTKEEYKRLKDNGRI